MEKTNLNQENQIRKQILELGPLILFFIGNYFFGILWGTGILVVSTLISISASWLLDKKIPLMALVGCIALCCGCVHVYCMFIVFLSYVYLFFNFSGIYINIYIYIYIYMYLCK